MTRSGADSEPRTAPADGPQVRGTPQVPGRAAGTMRGRDMTTATRRTSWRRTTQMGAAILAAGALLVGCTGNDPAPQNTDNGDNATSTSEAPAPGGGGS